MWKVNPKKIGRMDWSCRWGGLDREGNQERGHGRYSGERAERDGAYGYGYGYGASFVYARS